MSLGVLGTIVGVALGIVGSVVGVAASLRRAKSDTERRFVIRWTVMLCVLIVGFLIGVTIVPAPYRAWVWSLYAVLLPLAIVIGNRGHARLMATEERRVI